MEGHRVKNIIIVILLIVNGFLLVIVGARRSESLRYERAALEGSIQVLSQNGIELSEDAVSRQSGYQSCTTQRDLNLENRLASALLGCPVEGNSRGGGLYIYSADHGQISFRAGGELTSQLEKHAYWKTADPESYSAALMGSLELETRRVKYDVIGGNGQVVYQQMQDQVPLFSCQVTLTYEDGYLVDLSGNLLAMAEPAAERGELLSLPTILMHFLDDVLTSGDVCSAILTVEPGYLMTQSFTSAIGLQPVWYISTNTADYYVDGMTGELSRVIN